MFRVHNGSFGPSADVFLACLLVAAFGNVPVMAQEKVLHVFQGGSDGEYPQSSLIADAGGNLYGTTRAGGNGTGCQNGTQGCGTIFKLGANNSESVSYAFKGGGDGAIPAAGLIADGGGNLYGTTQLGGTANQGAVFELATNGTETVLYSFQGGADGSTPLAGLIEDDAGNFYGTTTAGGNGDSGTVFEIASGGGEAVFYAFPGGSDGSEPGGGSLIRDS